MVTDLTYTSPRGGRVGAYLVVPKAPGKSAGILFGHWGNGTRAEFLPEAELFAQVGAVSLLPDYPWDRPEPSYRGINNLQHPEQDLQTYAQTVVDLRRGLDLLLGRPDVDARRIAYVGHSYGAQWGAILVAVDHRIGTAVLMGGTPTGADVLNGDSAPVVDWRKRVSPAVWNKYIEVNSPLDAINFIGAAALPVLFQFATFEQYFTVSAMERYARAANQPKTVCWYDTAHDLNDVQVLLDRADWLHQHIGIGSIRPFLARVIAKYAKVALCRSEQTEECLQIPRPFALTALWAPRDDTLKGSSATSWGMLLPRDNHYRLTAAQVTLVLDSQPSSHGGAPVGREM